MRKKRKLFPILITIFLIFGLLGSCTETGPSESAQSFSEPAQSTSTAEPTPSPEPEVDPSGEFSIRFIDVGQADAALITCDGEHMLIDGGNREDSSLLYSLLERENISHFRYVVGTHAHEDHIGGIPGALQKASADLVLSPVTDYDSKAFANFKKAADANGGIVIPSVGDTYDLGSARFTIVGVNSDSSNPNNTSIVLRLVYGDTSFLFTGDAERETEQVLLNSSYTLKSDVLKVGHHGSDTSTTYPFLREVMPQYAVISCGAGNSYGHPDEGVLSKLRDANAEVFRTDLQGDILCTSDGTSLSWETQKTPAAETNPTANPMPPETQEAPLENPSQAQFEAPAAAPQPAPATQPSGETFIGNVNTKKVHHTYCSYLPNEENRTYFSSLDDALNQGYVPCKKCF